MILSGDQLYKMDLEAFLLQHIESGAELTIASTPVTRELTSDLGILKIDDNFVLRPDASTMKSQAISLSLSDS